MTFRLIISKSETRRCCYVLLINCAKEGEEKLGMGVREGELLPLLSQEKTQWIGRGKDKQGE